jgi:hypothetical protein
MTFGLGSRARFEAELEQRGGGAPGRRRHERRALVKDALGIWPPQEGGAHGGTDEISDCP